MSPRPDCSARRPSCSRDARRTRPRPPGRAHRPSGKGQTTLTVGVFGAFGLQEAGLYDEYMAQNPGIRIEQTSIERNENYYPQLLTHLGTGSGLADIQAVEVNNIAEITSTQADKLVDLGKAPGVDKASYLPWKWAQGTASAAKGGATVGLGTDIGPQGICYRKDLFEAAGLPGDRAAVGALWAGDWNKYLEAGKAYKAKAGEGKAFVDSASGVMAAVTGSSAQRFYDEQGKVVYKTNPAVRGAFDLAASFATEGLSAKLQQFTPAWDQGFANGTFATVSCPAWMLGYIQDKAGPAGKDKWDVAAGAEAEQLGRLVPGGAEGGQARRGGGEAGGLADGSGAAGEALREAGQFPERERRVQAADGFGRAARLLRRRPDRRDLREGGRRDPGDGGRPEGPGDRTEPGGHRDAPGRPEGPQPAGGLGGRGEGDQQRPGPVRRP